MKHHLKRSVSLLLVLVMIVSVVSGLPVPAQAAAYTYNWGYRGTTATSLSAAAEDFYADNDISYEDLAVYAGNSDINAVPDSELYAQLRDLMQDNHSTITSYEDTKALYKYTDCQGGGGVISSFYSGTSIGPEWDGTWNREHTWPNSKGLGGDDENDIMMLRPTATTENSGRGNKAYGAGSSFYDPNLESDGVYDLHGDVARIVLYVYTRWGNTINMWGIDGVIESKDVLLSWMQEDPVDTWEMGRNDAVQSITGTRNVFVDYPELAYLLFDEDIPASMTTPSGKAGSVYTVTATANDDTMGTVSVSGKNINAVPAEGYLVSGYTVLEGAATVTQNGNAFTVSAFSDCTIRINFEPKTQTIVTYIVNGVTVSTETAFTGDSVTLPNYTGTVPEGYTFLGWSDVPVNHSEKLPTIYQPEGTYTVTDGATIYAVFSYVAIGSGSSGIWTLVTDASQLTAGEKIVLTSNEKGVVAGELGSGTFMTKVLAEFSQDLATIPTLPADALVFTLGGGEGAWTFCDADGNLLGATAVKKLALGKGTSTWSISIDNGTATIQNGTSSYGRILYNAGYPRFTTYTSNASSSMLLPQIYMLDTSAGTTYYTTASCVHEDTVDVNEKPATCTEDGYTAGVYCNDCETYISGYEKIPSPGHSYETVTIEPTATTDGYTTYTCAVCTDNYTGDIVPALGETYTVSFCVPEDVSAVADMSCNLTGIILPEAEVPAVGNTVYTFLGWTTGQVNDVTTKPVIYESGTSYVAPSDITLYALYTYCEGGSGESAYVLVENADQLTAGSKIVIASADEDVAMSTQQNGNNRGQADITKNTDKTITLGEGVAELILGEGAVDDTWSFYCPTEAGYLYAASSSGNYLKTKAALEDNSSFKIELGENGAATVTAQGDKTRNLLRYNSTYSIFSCYASGQGAVCFYIETVDGTVYYTTDPAASAVPPQDEKTAVAEVTDTDGAVQQYETLAEALTAATSGQTVTLLCDTYELEILLRPGVTLDIGSNTLTTDFVIGLKGSAITATLHSGADVGGKLVVPQDSISLSTTAVAGPNTGYKVFPVWNEDHYVFAQVKINEYGEHGALTLLENNTTKLEFLPNLTSYVRDNLFKTDGCADNDVSIIIRVSWTESQAEGDIKVTQEYFYTTSLVQVAMNKISLTATTSGCDTKEGLEFTIAVVTEAGTEICSQTYVYADYATE